MRTNRKLILSGATALLVAAAGFAVAQSGLPNVGYYLIRDGNGGLQFMDAAQVNGGLVPFIVSMPTNAQTTGQSVTITTGLTFRRRQQKLVQSSR
jgi:hypothetical protein